MINIDVDLGMSVINMTHTNVYKVLEKRFSFLANSRERSQNKFRVLVAFCLQIRYCTNRKLPKTHGIENNPVLTPHLLTKSSVPGNKPPRSTFSTNLN